MKKLFLAISICASLVTGNAALALQTAEQSTPAALADGPSQSKIAEAAALNWVKDLAHDMQLSADPLARAIAEVSLQLLAANADSKVLPSLTEDQKRAIYSAKTPVPVRILYLQVACAGYTQDPICSDIKIADALMADDGKNAFTVLLTESLRDSAAMATLKNAQLVAGTKKSKLEYRKLVKAQEAQNAAHVLQALSVSNAYYDYAQAYKAPILIAVKRRPPPPEILATLPIEVSALAAAFASEEIAAEIFANALITSTVSSYRHMNACTFATTVEIKAQCARVADFILANPKNSVASAGFALNENQDHAFVNRINAISNITTQKVVDPSILLSLDWLALRSVLNKAATQGDVSAIPDALAWAELTYAKIPNKPADVISAEAAAEAKARAEQEAKWKAEVDRNDSVGVTAAAVRAASEAQADAEFELEFDAVPPPAKPSSGCSPDADAKVDATAVEFKN